MIIEGKKGMNILLEFKVKIQVYNCGIRYKHENNINNKVDGK